jgi:hypothetical protein
MGYVEASGFQGVVWILQMDGSLEPVRIDTMASMWFMSASQVPAPSLAGPTVQRSPEHRRLAFALLLSVLSHALLLSLTFGGVGLGLPGLVFPGAIDGSRLPIYASCLFRRALRPRRQRSGRQSGSRRKGHRSSLLSSLSRPGLRLSRTRRVRRRRTWRMCLRSTRRRRPRPSESRWPLRPVRRCPCVPMGSITRRLRRSSRPPRSMRSLPTGHVGRAFRSAPAGVLVCGRTKRFGA